MVRPGLHGLVLGGLLPGSGSLRPRHVVSGGDGVWPARGQPSEGLCQFGEVASRVESALLTGPSASLSPVWVSDPDLVVGHTDAVVADRGVVLTRLCRLTGRLIVGFGLGGVLTCLVELGTELGQRVGELAGGQAEDGGVGSERRSPRDAGRTARRRAA